MGQQVLAVAGQVVGGYFFGPVGAAIGGAIGGYIGGVLFNEDQVFEGPRLSDLRIQTSNYGNAVPIIYGTYRCAGNIIWSTDIRERRNETEQGKGGPDTTQVDYQYDLDVAIAVGEPPIGYEFEGVERIYANGVLIYDTRSNASAQNVFASGQWATGTFLYPGNETQMPDPTMEAALGVGNVPAYRGTGYVVITGLQLNVLKTSTLPNFEFVVSTSATTQLGRQLTQVSGLTPTYRSPGNLSGALSTVTSLSTTIRVISNGDRITRIYDLDGNYLGSEPQNAVELTFPTFTAASPYDVWSTFEAELVPKPVTAELGLFGGAASLQIGGVELLDVIVGSPMPIQMFGIAACADRRHYLVLTGNPAEPINEWFLIAWDGEDATLESQGVVDATGETVGTANTWLWSPVGQVVGNFYSSILESDLKHAWQVLGQSIFVWEIDENNVMSKIISFTSGSLPLRDMRASGGNILSSIYADDGLAAIVNGAVDGSTSWLFLYSRLPQVDPDGMPLVDILTDLCERSNLPVASEVTFVGISDFVDGFAIGQTMTARAAMEVLRPAYHFDGIDSDTFKFVKRGSASIVDFDYVDLGAGSETATTHAVSVNRSQETEIPARINVKYLSVSADYQVAAQSARRETTGSREVAEINLPIVFDDDDEVAGIADILLRDRWAGAFKRAYSSTIEYAKYEPTDVVTVDDGLAVRTLRVISRIDKGSLIDWEAIDEDAEVYDSNAVAVQIVVPSQDLAAQGQSAFAVLDLPPLTELADGNESAAYVAAKGYTSPWSGVSIDISRNDGTTYTSGTGVSTASVMGVATTVLSDFLGGNVFDEASTVRVDVGAGTLSSATHAEVLDGANPCVIGEEILQFRTATLVTTGVYDLTGFLRGRKGTEQHIGTHVAGDVFVMLTTSLRNLPLQLSDRTLDNMLARGTTGNMLPSQGLVRVFSPVIARLMPYSPVHLSAVRNADGSWYLSWERRDRYMNDWTDVEVPMSEAAELYDVEIYNVGAELVETYTDVNDTYLDVDSDVLGGSPTPTAINFSIYQKSALVGRGFEANETITQAA